MNGRSRMDKYQSLRQEVANSTDASSENFDMRKDNSNIGYNGYHSNGSHVSLRSANSDDTANLPTTFPKTSTTDYDEMLREQEEFLKSLEEQFDNFRNTGSFSTIRENTADLTETVAEVMPEPVNEEPIIPEEISIETIEPENEPVEEIAPVEVEEVEVPELNITEPENSEEVKAVAEEPVIEVVPIEVEQVELETLMPADDRSEFTAPELVEFEMPEVKVEEPVVLQEETQEVIEEPEVQEEIVQETDEEPEIEEEPHQEIETAEVEAEEAIVTEEPVSEESEQEPEVNEQFDFDNPQAFKEEEQKEDFQEILDKLTVEDDVVDNTYMSLDMPWLDKNTNEPFEFFKEEEPVVEEPVKEDKPVIELPKVSSVFGPTAGIVHTGYYDSTHDLYSYNDYLKPQKTEAEPQVEEAEPEVTEPQEITEPVEKEETQDVTVVTNDAEEQMYHEQLEEYADILPHISAEYTPVEYQEEEFVPLVKETVETFEPEVIEEVVSDEEMNQYEDYEPVSQEPVRLEVNVEEPQQISVEEIETAEVEAEETPVIEEPVVEESVQEPEAVKESVLPEIEEFTEEDISAILDDYAPDFGKDGDYDIPERSEFTDTFTDVLNQTFAQEKNDAVYDDIDSLDADELMKQENIDDELYKEIVEDAARDFSEDELEEH
ncbi:MAG: hypothetical protein IJ115_05390, partial [Erysipelotrichaceae bacterium]|nr:hypothetical protein [Erysipelotrichaceae bacterium]